MHHNLLTIATSSPIHAAVEAVWRAVSAVKEEPVVRMADLEGMIAGQENAADLELARTKDGKVNK